MPSTFHTLERHNLFRYPSDQKYDYPALQEIVAPHIESFNALFHPAKNGLLNLAVADLDARIVSDVPDDKKNIGNKLKIWLDNVQVERPLAPGANKQSTTRKIYPTECRERLSTYQGKIHVSLHWRVNNGPINVERKEMGYLPIMVKSNRCNIRHMYPKELIRHHEESDEMGGYFIINGIEKIIRLLLVQRRNYPMALIRNSYLKRGPMFTPYGVAIRCAREDETTQSIGINYLKDGDCVFRFTWRKQEFTIPLVLVLKSLLDTNDKEIFDAVVQGDFTNTFMTDRIELMLRSFSVHGIYTKHECTSFLGERFRVIMRLPSFFTDEDVGNYLINKVVLVHLKDRRDKFNMLIFMVRKLYALVAGECQVDDPDSPQNQEVLLGGHLYGMIIKEKLNDFMSQIVSLINQHVSRKKSADFFDAKFVPQIINLAGFDLGQKLNYFLATGNLSSNSMLDLSQSAGYTVVAERLNFYRYISHFQSVHRGSFFAELKTTTVRKLRPEAWGFICPVHTPDGAPCGLLNHFTSSCKIITAKQPTDNLIQKLNLLGITKKATDAGRAKARGPVLSVQLDGRVVGWCRQSIAESIVERLRHWKTMKEHEIPLELEIGYIPPSAAGQYPGLYLFATPARMMRPVKFLPNGKIDMIGSFEQEISPHNVLSILANLTPFSDHNQSPRNMYQCQMAKQTMGTPSSAYVHRTDNKLYRLQTGQAPVVRPKLHDELGLDAWLNGTNAIVAVLSYTGYDMEDAMIINQQSHQRGFAYGNIYKSVVVDLNESRRRTEALSKRFMLGSDVPDSVRKFLDKDGLPFIGTRLEEGNPFYAYYNETTGSTTIKKYKDTEIAYVDEVRLIGDDRGEYDPQKIHIKLRVPRPPVIGDKFSSRHGQKGVLSQLWPQWDMPFTESGMQPDIIINPHAFPSRMTIGMFIESLAGKAGALHGIAQDCAPFKFAENTLAMNDSDENPPAMDYFGEQLRRAGFNYHGNEPMYSGITGEEFRADIYIGVVYYQRLRHMVSDKWQVRATGPVHNLTMQPVKGRKRAGGIRFGEMERDALLAHGVSYCLQDRLLNCSDYAKCLICKKCGSIFSVLVRRGMLTQTERKMDCRTCKSSQHLSLIKIPYAFKYLATELMSMGVKIKIETSP